MPTVGPDTLQSMIDAKAKVLALEAEQILMVNRDAVVQMADENDIAIVAIKR